MEVNVGVDMWWLGVEDVVGVVGCDAGTLHGLAADHEFYSEGGVEGKHHDQDGQTGLNQYEIIEDLEWEDGDVIEEQEHTGQGHFTDSRQM